MGCTTREDAKLHEVLGVADPEQAAVGHGDGLDRHPAVGLQQPVAGREEGVVVAPVDGFDHLDRHELVVGIGEVAVVLQQHGDLVLQTEVGYQLGGVAVLLDADGGGRGAGPEGRAAWTASPPQPVPISTRCSPGCRSMDRSSRSYLVT